MHFLIDLAQGGLITGRHNCSPSWPLYQTHVIIFLTLGGRRAGYFVGFSMSSTNSQQNKLDNKSCIFQIQKR